MRLLYHKVGSDKGVSPFDEALQEVARGTPLLRLASPYIGLSFLQRVLDSAGDWKLLSDVEAWLHSGNRKHRAKCWEFIAENLDRVRHVAGLHAKVAIGNNKLFLGSANFTEKGILGRAELSILVSEADTVSEGIAWFDELWEAASPPILEEGDALVSALDSMEWTQPRIRIKLTTTAPQIAAVLAETGRPEGFDLAGVMAKAGISESIALASLEEAYRQISDEWFSTARTFTFRELLEAINRISIGSIRDVWQLLTIETVNHWLGGLDPDGFDRYIHEDGLFRTFHAPGDNSMADVPAHILDFLLESIPAYPNQEPLPFEDEWIEIGISETHILPIVELLLETGFLMEHDIPGELESYSLDPDFDWPLRWGKFTQAMNKFIHLKDNAKTTPLEPEDTDVEEYGDIRATRTVIWNQTEEKSVKPFKGTRPLSLTMKDESQIREAMRLASTRGMKYTEMTAANDTVLSSLIEVLAERGNPIKGISRTDINRELVAHQIAGSLRNEFSVNGGVLTSGNDGYRLNTRWNADFHLRLYPRALATWKAAIKNR